VQPKKVVQLFQPLISEDVNIVMCKEFTQELISNALFQIGPLKMPGPNGSLPGRFFQKNWDTMRGDVSRTVLHFFATRVMPVGVNDTIVVLLPKKEEPENLKDFRPISLFNIIYKVVSKCLVNRLHPLLQDLIAPIQNVFVSGRMITDNVLIVFECLHAMEQGNNKCKEFGALQLDLTKAYDCVD
jgi:hypothetical protein